MNEQTNPEMLPDDEIPGTEPGDAQPSGGEEHPVHDPGAPPADESGAAPGDESESAPADESESAPPAAAAEPPAPAFDITHVKRVLEAALLSTPEPLGVQQLKRLFGGQVDADSIRKVMGELKDEWSERSIELTAVASGWRFRVKPAYQEFLDRITQEKPPRYSRAVLETLAIIAYRQPVTRGDIEEIRGVAVSAPTLKALEERGWIETVGHRETPGRPALFATTRKFLDDLNLRSLEELPALDELQAALEPAPALADSSRQDSLIDAAGEAGEESGAAGGTRAAMAGPADVPADVEADVETDAEAESGAEAEAGDETRAESGENPSESTPEREPRAAPGDESGSDAMNEPENEAPQDDEPAQPQEPEAHAG